MRLLLDESTGRDLEFLLPPRGIEADHVETLELAGSGDPDLLALARREYDAIVTKDRYRKSEPREAALLGMRAGLRIIELRFTGSGPETAIGKTEEQLDLLLRHRARIEQMIDPDSPLDEQARAVAAVLHPSQTVHGYMEKGDFWKLREVSLSYRLPTSIAARMGASRASVVLAGRNLGVWARYTGMDPEINWNGSGDNFGVSEFLTQPPVRYYTMRVNFTF